MQTYWQLIDSAAQARPHEVVVVDDYGRALTTTTLREEAERAAAGLLAHGIRPADVVSWQLPTTLEAAVLMAACARIGVTQNPIIPVLREREVGVITAEVQTRLLIVPEVWRGYPHGEMARGLGLDVLAADFEAPPGAVMRLPQGDPSGLPPAPQPSAECRWIYYSSGTTSEPKGARHSDTSAIASSNGTVELLGLGAGDLYPIGWPFAHIGGVSMLTSALRAGARLALFDAFDPRTTPLRMAEHLPTVLGSATPFFHAYLAAARAHPDPPLFPALRACVAGGAPTPEEVSREVAEVLGVRGVASSYGLTEFPVATSETPEAPRLGSTVGWLARDVEARIVDTELRLKGPQCFLGYVNPALNAMAFDEDGWFRTGDCAEIDPDGRVRIVGRVKDIIIRNAENISALEVENTLLSHPAVADVAVIGVPDTQTGERVCAFVVAEPGRVVTLAMLADHCRAVGLARYKAPEVLRVVAELPRNPMGKLLKSQLSAQYHEGAPSAEPPDK